MQRVEGDGGIDDIEPAANGYVAAGGARGASDLDAIRRFLRKDDRVPEGIVDGGM